MVVSKRVRFILSVIPLVLPMLCVAQSEPHHAPKQQTDFDVETPLQHPVVLPSGALNALKTSKLSANILRDCAENDGIKMDQIPSSWFAASWIELSGGQSSGLVIRAQHGCFLGAHITQFWLLSKVDSNYHVVFAGRADAFRVLSTRTSSFRDVQLIFIMQAGAQTNYVTFKYTNGEYKESGSRTERPYDN